MKTFSNYKIRDLNLKNRIVMSPMCMYSSDNEGLVKRFHNIHYGSRAVGGAGLIILEATAIIPNGRISSRDLGIWDDKHIAGLKSLADDIHASGSKAAIQLAHAGRKSDSGDEFIVAPSPIAHSEKYKHPRELNKFDIENLIQKFKDAARRAESAGFDVIEIHAAHGYLIHQFLSPLSNTRTDKFGGNLQNRTRFLKEILLALRDVWPSEKPIFVRFSATDYNEEGIDKDEIIEIIDEVKEHFDLADISTGGLVDAHIEVYPGYQVPYAEKVKNKCNIPTMAVGLIETFDQIEEIVSNDRSDLVALGRQLLREPYTPFSMAFNKGIDVDFPDAYKRAFK